MSYQKYKAALQEIKDLQAAQAVLHWDMETFMPAKGLQQRSRQLATLGRLAQEKAQAPELGELLQNLLAQKEQFSPAEQRNLELSWEDYQEAQKLSPQFVEQLSLLTSKAQAAWQKARQAKDFSLFAQPLSELLAAKREEAKIRAKAGQGHLYDSLLRSYEKEATVARLDPIFEQLSSGIRQLLAKIAAQGNPPQKEFLNHRFPADQQWAFSLELLEQMGYDFEAGRQDASTHPFTTSFGAEDVRITSRIDEEDLMSCLGSSIHEGGHALYEQGLLSSEYGLPLGEAVSLSIHESQSRLWEQNVAGSEAYWQHNFDRLQSLFPSQLSGVKAQDFYRAINYLAPNFIRTEADEVHYHLHVGIRYQLEKQLIGGELEVDQLEAAWNEAYERELGIRPDNPQLGVLQDIHWSAGLWGYFPTYSLGSLYASQFFAAAQKALPELQSQIAQGELLPLRNWLRKEIHEKGRHYSSETLCQQLTGQGLSVEFFLAYLEEKYRKIYNF